MDHHHGLLSLGKVLGHYGFQHLGEEVITKILGVKNNSSDGPMNTRTLGLKKHQS